MRLNSTILQGEQGTSMLIAMIRTYEELSGWHVQFNVVDNETLREAQAYPEKHKNLIVRVAGYSAFFTQLHKNVQDDIIKRTQHII